MGVVVVDPEEEGLRAVARREPLEDPRVHVGRADARVDALGDVAAGVLGFVNAILNPETWARVLAIIGGAVLAMVGFYMVWQSTASEA